MNTGEWARSRYWLCHFLQSRHERVRIDWGVPPGVFLTCGSPVARWLARSAAAQAATGAWVIGQAVSRCGDDPAYIQSIRLLLREQRYHGQLMGRMLVRAQVAAAPAGVTQDLFIKLGRPLGMRYTLSAMLLADLIEVAMLERLAQASDDAAVRGVCTGIIREKRSHIAFHTERLTKEFADFNFVRRNVRRLRLRAMFGAKLGRLLVEDRACIAALGCRPHLFVRDCWRRIVAVLEVMVPYHRDVLLAALLAQDRQPYGKAEDSF